MWHIEELQRFIKSRCLSFLFLFYIMYSNCVASMKYRFFALYSSYNDVLVLIFVIFKLKIKTKSCMSFFMSSLHNRSRYMHSVAVYYNIPNSLYKSSDPYALVWIFKIAVVDFCINCELMFIEWDWKNIWYCYNPQEIAHIIAIFSHIYLL